MNIPLNIPELPRSPLSDEQYAAMLKWYNSRQNVYDMIARLEKTKVFTQEQIDQMRHGMDDSVAKVSALLQAFADLHPGA